jgi:hypothetical protein
MKVAIMQPYFMPYIGYFQLMAAVDNFVVYDNIKYTKKGWINRNRILVNGKDDYITLPLKRDSDYLNICERHLSDSFSEDKLKTIQKIKSAYQKAPHFYEVMPLVEEIFDYDNHNLFNFIFNSLKILSDYLELKTNFIISSTLPINHNLKSQEKVIAICNYLNADTYINPIGGLELYDKTEFNIHGIDLSFVKTKEFAYNQFNFKFVPWLSILDVLMFNPKNETEDFLNLYDLQ